MAKKCLIAVEGGLGKNVMLTSIMPEIAKKYEEIYVVSPYFEVFKACSYVTDAFPMGQGSLYQELVLDDDCDVYWKEPYSNQKFIKKQCHLFDAWAEEYGITLTKNAMDYYPILDNIENEFPNIVSIVNDIINKTSGKYIIVQFCGGQSPLGDMNAPYNDRQEAIKRNYYKGQQIVDELHKEYPDCTIIHYALKNEPNYNGTEKIQIPSLAYHLLARQATKIVCTDSSLQHLCTHSAKDLTVIWGETRPEHFGYSSNKNICAKNVMNSQPYFKPLGTSPSIVKMPTVEEVMEVVKQ